ncbi:MAG: gamma-glutamyltransferase family protein [Albidovulum sp.]|nr:gamma-glutamyltransferase family protein [Albidovulum sp.]
MVSAPHHLAAQAGLRVLRDGGNAIEATVAAAATITVVYPHMNALGGDSFCLIHFPGGHVKAIDACGAAASVADFDFYRAKGCKEIPPRGPLSALTVAGAVSGWDSALQASKSIGGRMPLERLFEDAIYYAERGMSVTRNLAANAASKSHELEDISGFGQVYLPGGVPIAEASQLKQPRLAATLRRLASAGLGDFYRGELARSIAADLARAGSPVLAMDLFHHEALEVEPLSLAVAGHKLYNMPPPTQGLASLILLGVYERLGIDTAETAEFVHGLVEATKRAFRIRDAHVTDPEYMQTDPESFLSGAKLDSIAAEVDPTRASPWANTADAGDTVWLGVIDGEGLAVSFIQSIYWEFGSGLILDETGIAWQNRGTSFSLDPANSNFLAPGRRPFHTIQPAIAHLADGRVMAYGTMGGDGQPQTQAMIFARHVLHGQDLQSAVSAPRWLLGRTWGDTTTSLRIEDRFDPAAVRTLEKLGHPVQRVGSFDEITGHAGAIVRHKDGLIEGAADPRSDGAALGF